MKNNYFFDRFDGMPRSLFVFFHASPNEYDLNNLSALLLLAVPYFHYNVPYEHSNVLHELDKGRPEYLMVAYVV